jgi:lysophospholipase L1-like esterase
LTRPALPRLLAARRPRTARPQLEELELRDLPTTLVMPLGASITAGYPENVGGYRLPLLNQLSAAGIDISYVGSQTTYNSPSQPDLQHEGHPGYLIADADALVQGGLLAQYNPDLILLYVGTNNLFANENAPWAQTDYRPFLDDIFAAKPNVQVIVAPLFPAVGIDQAALDNFNIGTPVLDAQQHVVGYTGGLAQVVTAEQQLGYNITFVDAMRTALTTADLLDGVHPTEAAYQTMAQAWLPAVEAVTPGQLSNVPPPAPTGLIAKMVSPSQIDLTWTRNSLTDSGFKVDMATSYDFTQGLTTLLAPAGADQLTVTGLAGGTTYYFRVRATNADGDSANSLLASPTQFPAGWTALDIGGPGVAGNSVFDGTTWTVQGSGSEIWNTADQFQYANTTVSGDAVISARVASEQHTDDWAKAGLMFRDGTSADAAYVGVFQIPNNQVEMQWRDTAGGASDWNGAAQGDTINVKWLKLTRTGDTFTAYYAATADVPADSDWVQIASHTLALAAPTAGLAVCALNNAALCTATFDNVSLANQWVQATEADFSAGSNSGTQVASGGGVQLASGSLGGTFTSAVFNAGQLASWGTVSWTAAVPAGTTLTVQVRSGNTPAPDDTWSAWTAVGNGQANPSPAGRYLQYQVVLTSTSAPATPVLYDITLLWF